MLIYTVPYNNDYKHTRPNINCGSLSGTFTCHDGHYFVIITISMSNTRSALGESCNGVKGRVKQLLERGRLPCTGHTQTIHKYYHTLAYEVSRTEYQALEETQHPMNINILLPEGQLDRTKGTLGGSGLDPGADLALGRGGPGPPPPPPPPRHVLPRRGVWLLSRRLGS